MAEPQPSTIHEGASTPALDGTPSTPSNGAKKEVDGKALDKAMKGLSVKDKAEEEKKKNIKIEAGDVAVLVRWVSLYTHVWDETGKGKKRRINILVL